LDEIRVLQLGTEDWSQCYALPENIDWDYQQVVTEKPENPYDVVFWDRAPVSGELSVLDAAIKTYTLFVTERVVLDSESRALYDRKMGQPLPVSEIGNFLGHELVYFFPKSYGEKYQLKNLAIAQDFAGSVKWNGNCGVQIAGDYGQEFHQIAYWRNNIPVMRGQTIDLWLEYRKDPDVSIALIVTQFEQGSISNIQQRWEFCEEELEHVVQLHNQMEDGPIFVSLHAKGSGKLEIRALHDRYSRKDHGYFLPGGERFVTSNREELFCYFDPGDRKPPLNVYFAGYKTMEGFEGHRLMKKLGSPFLLVSEARLEGGCFYMGTREYERMVIKAILHYRDKLEFDSNQVILSGLSMGTFGALYYGCDIRPHAMILGKPLASIGNVAANEKLLRPGGFPTSLDVLMNICGKTDAEAVTTLNKKFWSKFTSTDWDHSKFIVSYMIEDDYDTDAYEMLIGHLQSAGVQVYGKGIHGRHNDNTGAIVNWFVSQYEKILREDFGRGETEGC
jgi:accessory secretory protein Asp2